MSTHSPGNNKEKLKQRIEEVLRKQTPGKDSLSNKTVDELLEEVSVYHQELEYQNLELLRIRDDLEVSRMHFQALFDEAPVGYVITDTDFRITSANKFFLQMVCAASNEVKGVFFHQFIDPQSQDQFYQLTRSIQKGGNNLQQVLAVNGCASQICTTKVFSKTISGDRAFYLFALTDISGEQKAMRKLEKSEARLSDLNATKDKLFSIIAHDLRSPFTSILGFSGFLKENVKSLDVVEIESYAGLINESANQTLRLLDNLLDWAQLQQGGFGFTDKKLLLREIVKEVAYSMADGYKSKNIGLKNEVPDELIVTADEDMLKIILRNLLNNALKYSYPGNDVLVDVSPGQGDAVISVKDNGTGISRQNLVKLFSVGNKFTTRGTNNEKSTGLGLLLCKELIEKYGGRIWVDSKEGQGSVFSFSIPQKSNKQ